MPAPPRVQEDLQRAIHDHLREQEQSLATFLGKVAELCEGQDSTAYFASFLRKTGGRLQGGGSANPTPRSYNGTPANVANRNSITSGGIGKPQSIRIEALSASKPATQSIRIESLPVQHGLIEPEDAGPNQGKVGTVAGQPLKLLNKRPDDDGIGVPENVQDDVRVPRLPFIGADGKLIKETTTIQRMGGERLLKVQRTLNCLIDWWEPMDNWLSHIVEGAMFKVVTTLVIVFNFLYIIAQSNYKVSNLGEDEEGYMVVIGYAFTAFYVTELICSMLTYGKYFFKGPEAAWNIFDFCIVTVGLIELSFKMMGAKPMNTSFLRVIRFMRISRVLRMFSAMRAFKEVKIMVDCLAGSFNIFTWCTGLFLLMLSLFAVFFTQGVAAYLIDNPDMDPEARDMLIDTFGSISSSILTLFKTATGGNDWQEFYDIIRPVGPQYDYLFLFYVGFYSFAFLNVISGVFCEKAMNLAAPSEDELMCMRYEKEHNDATTLYALLDRVLGERDAGLSGQSPKPSTSSMETMTMDTEAFHVFSSDPEVEKFFEVRGVKPSSAQRFFRLLCELNNTDKVDFPTFVSACVKLDGFASNIDVHVLSVRQLHGLHQMQSIQLSQFEETKHNHQMLQNHMLSQCKPGSTAHTNLMAGMASRSNGKANNSFGMSVNDDAPVREISNYSGQVESAHGMTTTRTNWSDVQTKMDNQFSSIADDLKGQLSTLHQELKNAQVSGPQSGDIRELKAGGLPSAYQDLGMGTPRTLMRNFDNEKQKAKDAQDRLEAFKAEAAEIQQKGQVASSELQIQKRNEEELQHKLIQQERIHERTIKEVVSQTHSREAELKMLVKTQAAQLEQMGHQMRSGSRGSDGRPGESPPTQVPATSIFSLDCAGTRDRGAPTSATRDTMVDNFADGRGSPTPYPQTPIARPGYQGGDYR